MRRRNPLTRSARPWRRAAVVTIVAVLLVLLAHPLAGADSDLFQNIAPASQVPDGALMDAYPLGRYSLDHHFDAVKAGLLKGVDVSGIPPTIAWMLAQVIWTITAFLAQTVITLFTFAFSLDLLNGSGATGGQGALAPVAQAVRSIYQTTFGAPWLALGVLLAGLWALYQALIRRRYAQTVGSLALSVVLVVCALAFVTQPERVIGGASQWSNRMSGAFLSLTSHGTVSDTGQAKRAATDQLFGLLVYRPWAVLQFGGLEHCVRAPIATKDPQSVAVRPLSSDPARDARLADRLRKVGEVQADGKVCIHNERKYAPRFLRIASGSKQRDRQHEALAAGDTGKLDDNDPAKHDDGYRLSAADKPAAEAMGKSGQYQRLLLALVIFVSQLGALALIGALSIGVILAQVLVLVLLAFAPLALVAAVLPGRGHDAFLGWLTRLAGLLLRKAIYSLVLAVLLAVMAALQSATSNLGWLLAFGLQAVFCWAVLLGRRQLVGQVTAVTTGTTETGDRSALRIAGLYAAARATRNLVTRRDPGRRTAPDEPQSDTRDEQHGPPPPRLPEPVTPAEHDERRAHPPVDQPTDPGTPVRPTTTAAVPAAAPNLDPSAPTTEAPTTAVPSPSDPPQSSAAAPPAPPAPASPGERPQPPDSGRREVRATAGPQQEAPIAGERTGAPPAPHDGDDHRAAAPPLTLPGPPPADSPTPEAASTAKASTPLARDLAADEERRETADVAMTDAATTPPPPVPPVERRPSPEPRETPPPSDAGPAAPPEVDR